MSPCTGFVSFEYVLTLLWCGNDWVSFGIDRVEPATTGEVAGTPTIAPAGSPEERARLAQELENARRQCSDGQVAARVGGGSR